VDEDVPGAFLATVVAKRSTGAAVRIKFGDVSTVVTIPMP
jgi:hypothetical protein